LLETEGGEKGNWSGGHRKEKKTMKGGLIHIKSAFCNGNVHGIDVNHRREEQDKHTCIRLQKSGKKKDTLKIPLLLRHPGIHSYLVEPRDITRNSCPFSEKGEKRKENRESMPIDLHLQIAGWGEKLCDNHPT